MEQLLTHFNTNRLFHSQQFGFTKARSTIDAGVCLVKYIFEIWEEKRDAIGIFCDLSKAFDCVDHQTLIVELNYYGIEGKSLDLIRSYLTGRTQTVVLNRTNSAAYQVRIGVPQGSILGPLLLCQRPSIYGEKTI
jgi:hypothetical protein